MPIPEEYQHLFLMKCPPTKLETEFARQFPGQIATYQHSDGILILRQVTGATRKLHNTSTCLQASGFDITEPRSITDTKQRQWTTYRASNKKNRLVVKSTILDRKGNSWTSAEEWFWHAFFHSPYDTYLAITELQPEAP